jgi:hypothetical protein
MKKNLEKKILERAFKFETKRTVVDLIGRLLLGALLILMIFILGGIILAQLNQQQTLEVLEIFSEDREVLISYISDVVETLYYEIPKVDIAIFAVFVLFLVFLIVTFIKNFKIIKNKIKSLVDFWSAK